MTKKRGWLLERTVRAVDTAGRPLDVTVGVAKDHRGLLRLAVGIGNANDPESGPTALFGFDDGTGPSFIGLCRQMLADMIKRGGA